MLKYYIQQNYPDLSNGKQRSDDELRVIMKEAWDFASSKQLMGLIKTVSGRFRALIDIDA